MKVGISSLLAVVLLSCSAGAFAQQSGAKPEQQIKWRQSVYQVLSWNSGRIKANVEGQYNKDEVVRAANAIAALANSGVGSLFGPGTETGKGWKETATKPEFFKNPQKVGELAGNFNREANELARIAATGDAAAVKAQFGSLSKTCKACHDDFKAKN